jgi:hypothetical protein
MVGTMATTLEEPKPNRSKRGRLISECSRGRHRPGARHHTMWKYVWYLSVSIVK